LIFDSGVYLKTEREETEGTRGENAALKKRYATQINFET
jgi:hypothetical protein